MSTWDSTAQHGRCDGRNSSSFRWPLKNLLKCWQFKHQTAKVQGKSQQFTQSTSVTTASPSQKKVELADYIFRGFYMVLLHAAQTCVKHLGKKPQTSEISSGLLDIWCQGNIQEADRKPVHSNPTRLLLHLVALKKSGAQWSSTSLNEAPPIRCTRPSTTCKVKGKGIYKAWKTSWLLLLQVGFWHLMMMMMMMMMMMPLDTEMLETMINLPYLKPNWARSRQLVTLVISFHYAKLLKNAGACIG